MGKFSEYPAANAADYANATTFLIQNESGTTKLATLDGLNENYFGNIYTATLTVPNAQVLTANSTPVAFGLTVPSGYAVSVFDGSIKIDNPSSAYATNVGVNVRTVGADEPQLVSLTALNASVTSVRKLTVDSSFAATDTQLIAGADIEFFVPTGNTTTGDADVTLDVAYRLIAL